MVSKIDSVDTADARHRGEDSGVSLIVELSRKALHLLVIALPLCILVVGKVTSLWFLIPAAILAVTADVARARSARFASALHRLLGFMMRPDEIAPQGGGVILNGATWMLISLALVTLVFPVEVAGPTFIMFLLADAAAAIAGRAWGRRHWPGLRSTLEGSAAFLVIAAAVVWLFPITPLWAGLVVAVLSTVVEALPGPFNDNLRVPFVAATCLYLLQLLPPLFTAG